VHDLVQFVGGSGLVQVLRRAARAEPPAAAQVDAQRLVVSREEMPVQRRSVAAADPVGDRRAPRGWEMVGNDGNFLLRRTPSPFRRVIARRA
jgi:hypothetical protein